MAKLYINSVTPSTFKWSVHELSSAFTSSNYSSIGISKSYFTSGTTTRPNVLTYTQNYNGHNYTESETFYHGLNAGTYTLYGFTSVGGKYYSCGSVTITIPSSDATPPSITNIWCSPTGWTNKSTLTISANITDSSGIYSTNLSFNGKYYDATKSGNAYTWTVPTPTVYGSYDIEIAARDNNNNIGYGKSKVTVGLDTTAPTVSYSEAKFMGGGIRAGANATDNAGASGVDYIYFKISSKNSNTDFSSAIGVEGDSVYHTFTADKNGYAFELGATYYVEITAKDIAGNYSNKTIVKVVPSLERPITWSWNDYERYAFENRGAISTLTWQRWNAFLDNIKGVASWYHNNSSDVYGVEKAKMSDNSKILTAERFNIVKNAIGSMNATGISDREKGDFVLGSYFITLSLKLSEIKK